MEGTALSTTKMSPTIPRISGIAVCSSQGIFHSGVSGAMPASSFLARLGARPGGAMHCLARARRRVGLFQLISHELRIGSAAELEPGHDRGPLPVSDDRTTKTRQGQGLRTGTNFESPGGNRISNVESRSGAGSEIRNLKSFNGLPGSGSSGYLDCLIFSGAGAMTGGPTAATKP
jgi:hypothetical protein